MEHTAESDRGAGRQESAARLHAALEAAAAGRGGCLLITGEPGAGKSALLAEGVERARRLGFRVLTGAAEEAARDLPLRTALNCLRAAASGAAGAGPRGGTAAGAGASVLDGATPGAARAGTAAAPAQRPASPAPTTESIQPTGLAAGGDRATAGVPRPNGASTGLSPPGAPAAPGGCARPSPRRARSRP
ncbi:AAA family ATPase, partial [Streptomyces sp. URMC 123]|uniref:AAA family ATPase n=1 Tax=Streptomyces sp. URMC 123 TaxID=3423403 RepID=UPI003F1AE0C7